MIDVKRLSPAPWGVSKEGDMVSSPSSKESVRRIKSGQFGFISRRICINKISEYMDAETIKIHMEFIALARNAFDVMMRRGWCVDKDEEGDWSVMQLTEFNSASQLESFLKKCICKDPFTALVEADVWYRENVEKIK